MKRNKKIQKYVDESMGTLKNDTFINLLKKKLSKPKQKIKGSAVYAVLAGATSTCVIIIVLLSLFILTPTVNDTEKPQNIFYAENMATRKSSVTELNAATKHIDFVQSPDMTVTRVDDSLYDEILYFNVALSNSDTLESVKICVKKQRGADYTFVHNPYDKVAKIDGYIMNYVEECTSDENSYLFQSKGEIDTGDEIIYIQYKGIGAKEKSGFIACLNRIFK